MWATLLVAAAAATAVAGASDDQIPINATALTPGVAVSSSVGYNGWQDFYVHASAASGLEAIEFVVEAETEIPTGLSVYVFDGSAVTVKGSALSYSGRWATSSAIDADNLSRIGNMTHRQYFGYVGACYLMKGGLYFVSVHGATPGDEPVPFTVTARPVVAKLQLGATANGHVCDGKYVHHYWEETAVRSGGGVSVSVAKTSGGLEAFYLRPLRCAVAGAADQKMGELFGHGLSTSSVALSAGDLNVGKYYISVRGSAELCGEYTVSVRNLNQAEFMALPSA